MWDNSIINDLRFIIDNIGIIIGGLVAVLVVGGIVTVICLKKKKPGDKRR